MRLRKLLSVLLVALLTTVVLSGCNNKGGLSSASMKETLTIDIYDAAANYQGLQNGWFQKVIKDKFNLELNIISPQVAGDSLYQTRASTGNLGDIVILDGTQFKDCISAGLIKDISAKIPKMPNISEYKKQIDTFNKSLPGNTSGATYGIPCQMTNTSPMAYSQDFVYSSPLLRWDLYSELGKPDIADLDGLLDVLAKIMKAHPKNSAGDPAYAFSLWPDWDGGDGMLGIANAVQLTTWYGEKIKGSAILTPDEKFIPITDKNASYHKILKFLNKAYRMGLVDPDSGTQDWNAACAKMSAGSVYLMWYSWQVGFWNTQDRLANGSAFITIPVKDQKYYADSDTYYGSGRVFGIGSKVDGAKYDRIMKFLDWYASPEGLTIEHCGIKDFNYTVGKDGKFTLINDNALMDNLPVPAAFGGGGYKDGNNAINQWFVDAISINPNTKERYDSKYWSSYKTATMTRTKTEWAAKFGAAEPAEYMKKNNVLIISPNVSVSLPSDTSDISVIRNQCSSTVNDYSWKMIFAKDDAAFEALWDKMSSQMDGFGFKELLKFDIDKYQIELNAKTAAKNAK